MSFFNGLENLPREKLKELAGLCAGIFFPVDSDTYYGTANVVGPFSNFYKLSSGNAGGAIPGCTMYAYDASSGTSTIAAANSNTSGLSVGSITQTTRYTLECAMAAGGTQSVALTISPATSVSVASTANAAEPSTPGTITVTRTGSTAAALTANYTVSGSATAGADYATFGGSVVIPLGQASVPIIVTPIDDSLFEGDETVVVTLAAGSYSITGSPATMTLIDNETVPPPTFQGGTNGGLLVSCAGGTPAKSCRVRRGNPITLSWTVNNLEIGMSCTLLANPSASAPATAPQWPGENPTWSDSATSNTIQAASNFILRCGSDISGYTSSSASVQLVPTPQEI